MAVNWEEVPRDRRILRDRCPNCAAPVDHRWDEHAVPGRGNYPEREWLCEMLPYVPKEDK